MTEIQPQPVEVVKTDKKPRKKLLNLKGWWWKLPVALLGLWMLGESIAAPGNRVKALPECEGDKTERFVGETISKNALSKMVTIELLALKNIQTIQSGEDKVVCTATALTNAGESKIQYDFSWLKKERGEYYISIKELF